MPNATLWDEADIRSHALMTEAVHRHGALAGVELWHGGASSMNRISRLPPLSPSGIPWLATHVGFMSQHAPQGDGHERHPRPACAGRARAARRAEAAGFDIVYVYAGMGYLPLRVPARRIQPAQRRIWRLDRQPGAARAGDDRGHASEAVGGRCGRGARISLEELRERPGTHAETEAHEAIALLADVPDLFDVKMDYEPDRLRRLPLHAGGQP